uniref:Uncharacterized protein n=1 Tax=Cannabis sativa TaxID=3483 RepID=A0A803PHA5_CANSA
MVSTIIQGHILDGFVDGTRPFPPEFIPAETTDGQPEVMGCATLAALVRALENQFGAHSGAKMDEYRTLIQTTRKGMTPMTEYLKQKKMWADMLALAGNPYPEAHLVSNVTSSLGIEYLSIVVQVEEKPNISWHELQDLVLSFNNKLEDIVGFKWQHQIL